MRLISLEISNYRVIKNVRISFPDRVIGIIGPNGAGKSSIIEAISWALYGNQAARTGKDEIKSEFAGVDDNCEVALEFSVNEECYRVIRRLVGRTERAEVELYRGEKSESVGVNETKAYVGQLLGLDWRGFLTSFLARQAELNALSDLQPSKRRDHIAGMLGIERLDKAIQRVKEDARLHKDKGEFLKRQVGEKDQVVNRIAELREAITNLADPVKKLQVESKDVEQKLGKLRQDFESAKKKRDEWLNLKSALEAEQRTCQGLDGQLQELQKELKQLQKDEGLLKELFHQLSGLEAVKRELEQLKEAKSRLAHRDELTGRQKTVMNQLSDGKNQQSQLEQKLKQLKSRLSAIDEKVEQQFNAEKGRLENARDEYSRLRAETESGKKDVAKLKQQLASISKLGPDSICERCRRPFGSDFEHINQHLSDELKQLRDSLDKIVQKMAEQKDSGEKLKIRVVELEKQKDLRYQLIVDQKALTNEKQLAQKQIEIDLKTLDEITVQLKKYGDIEFDVKQYEQAAAKVNELEKLQQKYNQLEGSLTRLPVVEKSIKEITQKSESSKSDIGKIEEKVAALEFDSATYEKVAEEVEKAQARHETAREEYLNRLREKELVEKELEGKLEQLKGFEDAERELEQTRSAHYYGEKLGRLFGEFRQDLIASIRPSLAEISSRLLSDMTEGKYSLVDLDEKYNIRVMDNGTYYGVDRFSGGEKDLANLCLRLAISLALTESAGLTRSFVILDEVFGSQDNQRKELILKAMGQLKQRFPQILLITHIDDVKDGVEEIIEVLPTGNGWSEVRVNGSSVQ